MSKNISLHDMMHNLIQVDDETWGLYAFSREILKRRIQPDKQTDMIKKAIACGKEYAKRIILEQGSTDINTIASNLKLKIAYHNVSMIGKRVLFARFTPPNSIEIMKEPITKASNLIQEQAPDLVDHFKESDIMNIILGHEIFHFVEDQFEKEIYTRTEKILLWKLFGYKNYSTIRTLGEIGAMAFTKELNQLEYSPFIMDVLLCYDYDYAIAEKIYHDVLIK